MGISKRRLLLSFLISCSLGAVGAGTAPVRASDLYATFERGRRDLPKVSLTFDGGSDAGFTERILSILREKNVTATFFLTGEYIRKYPEHVLGIADDGHEVGNHTWSHPHLTTWDLTHRQGTLPGIDAELILRELERTAQAYAEVTGRHMLPLWRAPYGEVNKEIARWAAADGFRHIGWSRDDQGRRNLDSLDWVADRRSPHYLNSTRIRDRLLEFGLGAGGLNGGIILMHLSTRTEDPGVSRLGDLIDALRERGYQIVPVSELLHDLGLTPASTIRTAAVALH